MATTRQVAPNFGPRKFVPEDSLADLEDDGLAVFLSGSENDVQETEITLSVEWVTYHELIGVVGNPPEELSWSLKVFSLSLAIFPLATVPITRVRLA